MYENASKQMLLQEIGELRVKLEEAQEVLRAIRHGEVDALVVKTAVGERIYTINGAEKPYRLLIEEMKEGAVVISEDNTILYSNGYFADMMKLTLDKVIGNSIMGVVPAAHMSAFKDLLTQGRTRKGRMAKEITLQAADSKLIPTHISANTLKMDNVETTFLVITDLTQHMEEEVKTYTIELEKAQIALFDSEQRWATTLASVGDAVMATDLQGRITFMNKVCEGLTGWTLTEATGKMVEEVFDIINGQNRKIVGSPVDKVLESGRIVGLANNTILCRRDGTEIWVDDSGAPIRNKEGKVTGVVLTFRDTSERRKMQIQLENYAKNLEGLVEERTKQLRDAERLAAIGATAGMVGHDIRNPLQTVTGELYLAKSELQQLPDDPIKEKLKESLEIIGEQTVYVNKIVSDLQDYAKPLMPVLEKVNLEQVIQGVIASIEIPESEQVASVDVEYMISEDFPKLLIDQSYLRRILQNLVTNALQAMPKGGKLFINAAHENGAAVILVQDTGEGIPEKVRSKIFMPLMTTKARGQGFGLAVVKRLTEALNGTVTFESEIDKGTTFKVTFPITAS